MGEILQIIIRTTIKPICLEFARHALIRSGKRNETGDLYNCIILNSIQTHKAKR